MAKLFHNVIKQHIDVNGKARMLMYANKLCLIISPIAPIDVPETDEQFATTFEEAKKFAEEYSFNIETQDAKFDENKKVREVSGLWIKPKDSARSCIMYGYIPIVKGQMIEGIPTENTGRIDPLRTSTTSHLRDMYYHRKLADLLVQYMFFEYSHSQNPGSFGVNNYVIIPDHYYDLSKQGKMLVRFNEVFYDSGTDMSTNGKLIITSESLLKRMLDFLALSLKINYETIRKFKNNVLVRNYYRTLSDFKHRPNQIIFMNKESIKRWIIEKTEKTDMNMITGIPVPSKQNAYIYRNIKINNGLPIIIQNVTGRDLDEGYIVTALGAERGNTPTLVRSLGVASTWEQIKVNPGYDPIFRPDLLYNANYIIYNEKGVFTNVTIDPNNKVYFNLFQYEDGSYAAMLFF